MMRIYNTVSYRVVKYLVLLALIAIAFQAADVPGGNRELAGSYIETVTTKNGEKMSFRMAHIPGGTFMMGSPQGEPGHKDDEGPQHEVRVAPFYLCTTETTLELFLAYYQETMSAVREFTVAEQATKDAQQGGDKVDAITGPTPVYGDMTMGYSKRNPAIAMTWHNAMTFCRWLSSKTGREYRLPTEAEWEYACRAGKTDVFGSGKDPNQLADIAWYEANSDGQTHEVGTKKPNAWGLHDMAGNVCEWVYDFYAPDAYRQAAEKGPVVNPGGPDAGQVHVARGGNHSSSTDELRCAARAFEEKWWRAGDPQIPKSRWWLPQMDIIGFRVARSINPNDQGTASQSKGKE